MKPVLNQKTPHTDKVMYHLKDTLKHVSAVQTNCVRLLDNWTNDDCSFINIFNNIRLLSTNWDGTVIGQVCKNSLGYDMGFTDPIELCTRALASNCLRHDQSKVDGKEYEGYVDIVYKLSGLEYGTPEFNAAITELDKPFELHALKNPHHPEYFGGMRGNVKVPLVLDMNIIQFTEMILDWTASAACRGYKFKLSSVLDKQDELDLDDLTVDVIIRNIKLLLPTDMILNDLM